MDSSIENELEASENITVLGYDFNGNKLLMRNLVMIMGAENLMSRIGI